MSWCFGTAEVWACGYQVRNQCRVTPYVELTSPPPVFAEVSHKPRAERTGTHFVARTAQLLLSSNFTPYCRRPLSAQRSRAYTRLWVQNTFLRLPTFGPFPMGPAPPCGPLQMTTIAIVQTVPMNQVCIPGHPIHLYNVPIPLRHRRTSEPHLFLSQRRPHRSLHLHNKGERRPTRSDYSIRSPEFVLTHDQSPNAATDPNPPVYVAYL